MLPHGSHVNEVGLVAVSGAAWAVAALGLWRFKRLGQRSLEALTMLGTVLISGGVLFSGGTESPWVLLYVWPMLALSFFPWRRALPQLAAIGVGYALVPGPEHLLRWSLTMVALTAASAVIYVIRRHQASLIDELEGAAHTDALTSLLNRRGFRERFELELDRARRTGRPLSLLVGDLDHFKQVNDRFGHDTGDRALRQVATALSSERRRIDAVARLGGEEFGLLLADTVATEAFATANRLRRNVRESVDERLRPLSISFGVATYPGHGKDADALMRAGDEALYTAKRLGRDRAVMHSPARTVALTPGGPRRLLRNG